MDTYQCVLKSGLEVSVRHATRADAYSLADLALDASRTSNDLPAEPHEFDLGEATQRRWLEKACSDDSVLALVATHGEALCGQLDLNRSRYARLRHHGTLGMTVRSSYRGQGVGRALLEAFLHWARAREDLERVFLEVASSNAAAIALYTSVGFVEEGRRARFFKFQDGRYEDALLMALEF